MNLAGTVLQIMAWVIFLGGAAAGGIVLLQPARDFVLALTYFVSGIVSGAILFGIGGIFLYVEDVAIDTRRTAVALEALVQRRTGVGSITPDVSKRVKPIPPRDSP